MDRTRELIQKIEKYGAHNYYPLPIVLNRGRAAKVWDVEGKEYIDFLSCYSALNFGHQHPALVAALKNQVDKLAVCSRAFHSELLCLFSEELAKFCQMDSVLFMNSGAEAAESAIKLVRKWGTDRKGIAENAGKILAMKNNFHGRTTTLISFSSEPLYRAGFGPLTPGFELVPFGDIGAMEAAVDRNTVGILLEPIQAEAGILVPPQGYLSDVRKLCTQKKILFMADEIQTGLGRTGRDFCYQHEGAKPDVLILGKSLGGGLLPVSAVLSSREVMDVFGPGTHGSTFGGNPLACAVGRAAVTLLQQEKLSQRAQRLGELMLSALTDSRLPHVKEVRGKGALIGIELDTASGGARRYCERLAMEGVLCKETHDYVIRLAPPLTIDEGEMLLALEKVKTVIQEL